MFSRIAEALKKMNAVTLDQLREIIHNAYTPSPITIYRENIFDIKSWLRDSTCTLKNHSNPHAFRFKLNEQGEVEMSYRNWAVAKKKEWEGPYVVLRQLPQDTPYVQRPDNLRCPSIEAMEAALKHVSVRMTPEEVVWWQRFVEEEKERRRQWEEMADEDYQEAGSIFDLLRMRYKPPETDATENDEAYNKREEELFRLFEKNNKFPKVSYSNLRSW